MPWSVNVGISMYVQREDLHNLGMMCALLACPYMYIHNSCMYICAHVVRCILTDMCADAPTCVRHDMPAVFVVLESSLCCCSAS